MTALQCTFERPHPWSLWHTVRFQRMGKHDPRAILEENRYVFSRNTPEGAATAEVCLEQESVRVRLWGPGSEHLKTNLPSMIGLDQPLLAADIPGLPRALQRLRALGLRRTLRPGALAETLVPLILQQLVTWREAAAIYGTLLKELGQPAPGPFSSLVLAPTMSVFKTLTGAQLRAMNISGRRAQAIMSTARYAGRIEDASWRNQTVQLSKMLLALPGMGPWTTAFYLGLELGSQDAVPTGDYHLPTSVAWAFEEKRKAEDADMLRILKPYRGHRFDIIRLIMGANIQAPRRTPRMPNRPRS